MRVVTHFPRNDKYWPVHVYVNYDRYKFRKRFTYTKVLTKSLTAFFFNKFKGKVMRICQLNRYGKSCQYFFCFTNDLSYLVSIDFII